MTARRKKKVKKYIGDKRFYRMVLAVVVPIMIQNGITNFVSLLGQHHGRSGGEQSRCLGVGHCQPADFRIQPLHLRGGIRSGYFRGPVLWKRETTRGVRDTLRFKLVISVLLFLCAALIFTGAGEQLIRLYLSGESESVDPEKTLAYGMAYLRIMIPGLCPLPWCSLMREP